MPNDNEVIVPPPPPAPMKTVEQLCAEHKLKAWEAAAVKAVGRFALGRELTEELFLATLERARNGVSR